MVKLLLHGDQPEIAVMQHGTVTMFEANCTAPYDMSEEVVFQSGLGDSHWAVNNTNETAILFVVDLLTSSEL